MSAHAPALRKYHDGYGIDCSCGFSDPYLWSEKIGAQTAFANHVLDEALPVGWPPFLAEQADQ